MSDAAHDDQGPTPTDKVITIRIQDSTNSKIEEAVKATGLKRADVIRLAIDRGVVILEQQLSTSPTIAAVEEGGES